MRLRAGITSGLISIAGVLAVLDLPGATPAWPGKGSPASVAGRVDVLRFLG